MDLLQNQYAFLAISGVSIVFMLTTFFIYLKYRKTELNALELKILYDEKIKTINALQEQAKALNNENYQLSAENIRIRSDIDNQKKYMEEKLSFIEQNKEDMALKFRDISNQIIKAQNEHFGKEQKSSFELLLKPFQEQMADFKQKVEKTHEDSIKFDEQLKNLLYLNQNLSKDAKDLSQALKGNKKMQGNWGEFQLERVLEISGLQKGINYTTQETFKNEENKMLRPDVIVNLPNDRKVIVDSKVSLNDYVAFVNEENEDLRKEYIKKYVQCLRNHIDSLSSKEYQKLLKDSSLDYVVIFIPIESAYVEAVKFDEELYDYAYKKNIAITTPSSLLPLLRTIESLWQIERRNKNVAQIAELGGSLYDKLCNFVEDMKKIDSAICSSKKNYDEAIKKLSTGKGNAISLATKMKSLGAKATKNLQIDYEEDLSTTATLITGEVANG